MGFGIAYGAIDSQTQVVEPHGELDLATAPDLQTSLDAVYDTGKRRIIVDLGEVPFIDSSGLRVLVAAHNKLVADGGALIVMCSDPFVRRVFDVARLTQVLNVVQSRREAVELARTFLPIG
jgi:anti-anti-sigma factor